MIYYFVLNTKVNQFWIYESIDKMIISPELVVSLIRITKNRQRILMGYPVATPLSELSTFM